MNNEQTRFKYPEMLRHQIYRDDDQQHDFFFTNILDITPMMVPRPIATLSDCYLIKVVEETSQDIRFLCRVRERYENPDIHRNKRLLYNGNRAKEYENRYAYLRVKARTSFIRREYY